MFKIAANPEFSHTVPILVPTDGGHREESLRARFRVIGSEALDSFQLTSTGEVLTFLREVLVSLDDLADAAGNPVPYNDEVRDQVLQLPYVRLALVRSYMSAITKAKAGN